MTTQTHEPGYGYTYFYFTRPRISMSRRVLVCNLVLYDVAHILLHFFIHSHKVQELWIKTYWQLNVRHTHVNCMKRTTANVDNCGLCPQARVSMDAESATLRPPTCLWRLRRGIMSKPRAQHQRVNPRNPNIIPVHIVTRTTCSGFLITSTSGTLHITSVTIG